jgi:biotin transport system substrate-specific component
MKEDSMTHTTTIDRIFTATTSRTYSIPLLIGAFALLTAAGAQFIVPVVPVPFTLQTVFVLLSGAFLGARKGSTAQAAYLMAGAVGMPVFAGFTGTFAHLLGPTGGYLLAFPAAAFITGYLLHDVKALQSLPLYLRALAAMATAILVVFACGVVWLNLAFIHDWNSSMKAGFAILSGWDVVKLLAAAGVYSAATKGLRK